MIEGGNRPLFKIVVLMPLQPSRAGYTQCHFLQACSRSCNCKLPEHALDQATNHHNIYERTYAMAIFASYVPRTTNGCTVLARTCRIASTARLKFLIGIYALIVRQNTIGTNYRASSHFIGAQAVSAQLLSPLPPVSSIVTVVVSRLRGWRRRRG